MAFLARALLLVATTLLTAFVSPAAQAVERTYAGHATAHVAPIRRHGYPKRARRRPAYRRPVLAHRPRVLHRRAPKRVFHPWRRMAPVRVNRGVRRLALVRMPRKTIRHAIWKRPVSKPKPHPMPKAKPRGTTHRSTLGAARWDPWQRAIAIPYQGNPPAHHLGTTAHPPRVFVDLTGVGPRYPQKASVKGQPTLIRFETASRGPDATRVVLIFSHPTSARVQDDRVRHELLIVPVQTKRAAPSTHRMMVRRPAQAHMAVPTPVSTEAPSGDQDPTLAAP